jgi:5'-AMP-activated protein kinase regulatory gamma subunit
MAKSSGLVLKKLLESYTVDSLPTPKGRAIVIDSQSSLLQGFETLVDNNILSAPVYDASKNKYIGFLDVRDLVSFVVFLVDEQKVSDTKTLKDIITHGIKMFKTPTTDGVTISYLSRRNKFIPVQEEATLWTAAQIIARQSVHRVPVVNKEGKVVNIISQSSLLGFLNDHLTELKEETDKTIGELRIGSRPVTSVNKDAAVIEAFRLMDRHRRSGVALVDNSGRLVGTTTGKDLGLFIKNPTLATLEQVTIFNFLNTIRSQQIDIKSPTIAVFEKDTLGKAIGLLAATKVHRVFVCDNEQFFRPIAVISITDILNYLIGKL